MKYKVKQGIYKIKNKEKFLKPVDKHMQSFKESNNEYFVLYKSGLELKSFIYCDLNPNVTIWSLEPFPIPYLSPKDCKTHRYYPDLFVVFNNTDKVIIEVKHSSEVKPKNDLTYAINQSKWEHCKRFCENNGYKFCILTEKDLQ